MKKAINNLHILDTETDYWNEVMIKKTPKVNPANEFKEIANDFTNPLEIIREAISNSFDAKAKNITITFDVVNIDGEDVFKTVITDDGDGMNEDDLENFFDLGNSKRKNDLATIGEKGHGTKVYFNSKKIELKSHKTDNRAIFATMNNVFQSLSRGFVPDYEYDFIDDNTPIGTEIVIYGYYQSEYSLFTHSQIKDYVLWKTKMGSIEKEFKINDNSDVQFHFKGLDSSTISTLKFGHIFPEESKDAQKLFDQHETDAPNYFCRKWVFENSLPKHPHIQYKAVFYVEGKNVKYSYNEMIKRQGKQALTGSYTVQERYGLWLCKDYIPIQTKNEWIVTKGYEFTRFHAFLNCQGLKLTANRGSLDNTSPDMMADIEKVVRDCYNTIIESEDYSLLDWLESEVKGYSSKTKEKKEYERRQKNAYRQNVAFYEGHKLIEPELESGVFSLLVILLSINKDLFPFEIVDYNTNTGIDLLVREKTDLTLEQSRIYYVELKNKLDNRFNHSFDYIHSVVCWDTKLKDGDVIFDLGGSKRTMKISNPADENDITHYYLEDGKGGQNIIVFVLKDYLKQKLGIDFRPRNNK